MSVNIGIVGYGNLGKATEAAISQNDDLDLVAIFTRRPGDVKASVPVVSMSDIADYKGKIDVMVLCGGSSADLPEQSPQIAALFNIVDSFDTHAKIPEHRARVGQSAKQGGTAAIISAGWDPGLFSIARLIGGSVLPQGRDYTFWGKGVSQGHSFAIRKVDGVLAGVQYTVPVDQAVQAVRAGMCPELTVREKHKRECYVVAKPGADKQAITAAIAGMPDYFADYDTTVHFVTLDELNEKHSGMPHGGIVIRTGHTASGAKHNIEFGLKLDSNPEFTASVLVACARAVKRLADEGKTGAYTMFDIPLSYLSAVPIEQLIKDIL